MSQTNKSIELQELMTEQYLRTEYIQNSISVADIADAVGVRANTVYQTLHKYNIPLRSPSKLRTFDIKSEYLVARKSLSEIAEEHSMSRESVSNYLKKIGVSIRSQEESNRQYAMPQNLEGFLFADEDWYCYWIGFIAADGYIGKGKDQNMLRIKIKSADAYLLLNFKERLKIENPIVSYDKNVSQQLSICSSEFVSHLAVWGIGTNKSLTIKFPHLPVYAQSAFIRGYFDGNGTIFTRKRKAFTEFTCRFISGSPEFLKGLDLYLDSVEIKTLKPYCNKNSYSHVLPVSGAKKNLIAFRQLIYANSSICPERKKQMFMKVEEKP